MFESRSSQTTDIPPPLGLVPLPLLVWDDPEWWALSARYLFHVGHVEGFLRCVECALEATGGGFADLMADANWTFHEPDLAPFVTAIRAHKENGHALYVQIDPANEGRPSRAAIVPAPEDFKLFDVPLPTVESWFSVSCSEG